MEAAGVAVAEVDAREGELLAFLAGQPDGERVDGAAEVIDETVGAGIDIGGVDVAVVDAEQGHHLLVGVAENHHAGAGVVDAGVVHHYLHFGEAVAGGNGDAAEPQRTGMLFMHTACEGHALNTVYTIVGGVVALGGG